MILPKYWLERPPMKRDEEMALICDHFLQQTFATGENHLIHYTLPVPKWQFLCHIADHHHIVLHGSGDSNIGRFEPRQPIDITSFGSQHAVYAAADGIWAMFFAILDRDAYAMSLHNACVRLADHAGTLSNPFYIFSISAHALEHQPWRQGTVYLLPRTTFHTQPPVYLGDEEIHIAQLASVVPVTPFARLTVQPGDFPFLQQIKGHDDERFQEYATAIQTGSPWPDIPLR